MARYNTISTTSTSNGAQTISSPASGLLTTLTGTAPYTTTIPNPILYTGQQQSFYNSTSGVVTLNTPSGIFAGPGSGSSANIALPAGSILTIVSDGANYELLNWLGGTVVSANVNITGGTIGTTTIGASNTQSTGAFTSLTANSTFSLTATSATHTISSTTTSTTSGTGALVVSGGVGVGGALYVGSSGTFGGIISTTYSGASGATYGTNQSFRLDSSTNTGYAIGIPASSNIVGGYYINGGTNSYDGGIEYNATTRALSLRSAGNSAVTILSSGYVGIATANPGQQLEINGNAFINVASGNPFLQIKTAGAGNNPYIRTQAGSNYWDIQSTFSATNSPLYNMYNGTVLTSLLNTGNFGIGVTTPQSPLTVVNSGYNQAGTFYSVGDFVNNTSYSLGTMIGYDSANGSVIASNGVSKPIAFWQYQASAYTEIARFDSAGNLIPATTNTYTLGSSSQKWNNYYGTVDNTVNINTNTTTNRPTLLVDFTTGVFDHKIFFLRNSIGTYTGPDGLIKTAPVNTPRLDWDPITRECKGLLIEETRTNYRTFSDRMDQASYSQSNLLAVIPNAALAPDGTWSATNIVENTSNGRHEFDISQSITNGVTYTYSVYAKAAGRNYMALAYAGNPISNFNLANGTVVGSSANITPAIQSVGNGWYRCAITFTASSTTTTAIYHCIISTALSGSVDTYTGNGKSGLYIWGGQFEVANYMTSYIPTTTVAGGRNSTGTYYDASGQLRTAAAGVNRYGYAYDGVSTWYPIGNIIEPAATNLLATSSISAFSTGQNLNTASVSGTPPDGSNSGIWSMTPNSSNSSHSIYYPHPVTSGATRTLSGYFKGNGYNYINIYADGGATYNMGNIVFGLTGTGTATPTNVLSGTQSYGIQFVGNGWYRCWVTGAMDGAQCYYHIDVFNNTPTGVYAGDTTSGVLGWGIQSELGSVMTSYIATSGATATRAADSASSVATTRLVDNARYTYNNLSSWYNQSASTVYVEHDVIGLSNNAAVAHDVFCFSKVVSGLNFGTETGAISIGYNNTTAPGLSLAVSGVGGTNMLSTTPLNTRNRTAVAWASGVNTLYGSSNGGITTLNVTIPTYQYVLTLGNSPDQPSRVLNGHIYKLIYYPTQLTNSELQELAG